MADGGATTGGTSRRDAKRTALDDRRGRGYPAPSFQPLNESANGYGSANGSNGYGSRGTGPTGSNGSYGSNGYGSANGYDSANGYGSGGGQAGNGYDASAYGCRRDNDARPGSGAGYQDSGYGRGDSGYGRGGYDTAGYDQTGYGTAGYAAQNGGSSGAADYNQSGYGSSYATEFMPADADADADAMTRRPARRGRSGGFPFIRCLTIRRRNSIGWRNALRKAFDRRNPTPWYTSSTWCQRRQCSGSSTKFIVIARPLRAMSGSRTFGGSWPTARPACSPRTSSTCG